MARTKRKPSSSQKLEAMVDDLRENMAAKGVRLHDEILHPQGSDKLSERIHLLVRPFHGESPIYDEFSTLVGFGCVAWNTSLTDEAERPFLIDDFLKGTTRKGTDRNAFAIMTKFINDLIRRKLELFPGDMRAIANFEVEDTGDSLHLRIASTAPAKKK